jgi:hypothetical protein
MKKAKPSVRAKKPRNIAEASRIKLGDSETLIPSPDAAKSLGVNECTMAAWRSRGGGPAFFKIGRRAFYSRTDIDAWIAAQRRESVPKGEGAHA